MKVKAILGIIQFLAVTLVCMRSYGADHLSQLPRGLRSGIGLRSPMDTASAKLITSLLQGLRKNLILETTRAERDVKVFRESAPGVVLVRTSDGLGSGAIIDAKGSIVTNAHVVGSNREVFVAFKPKDGSDLRNDLVFKASVEKIDEVSDLALLRMNTPRASLVLLKLGSASELAVGQDVHAIGHPEGERWSYTKGVISQIRDNYEWQVGGITHRANVIQTQTPINHGNSGGPLLDDSGRLIGVNTFGNTGSQGLNYAVAVNEVEKFLKGPGRIAPRQTPSPAQADFNCPEAYDTKGQRWSDILGCYNNRTSPPPNHWIVFGAPKTVRYVAADTFPGGNIDTLITNLDPSWQTLIYAFDTNCDGVIDVIGQTNGGRLDPDNFRSPSENMRILAFTTELAAALKSGKIPYPQIRVCQ